MENVKIINSRIQSAYDNFSAWLSNDPILLRGEIVVAEIQEEQANTPNYIPTVMLKVGDGVKKYSELDFIYAKSADVYSWAKKMQLDYNDLPETLITQISNLENKEIESITNTEMEEMLN